MEIHIHKDGQQLGPYTIEETYRYVQEGRLLQADLAWHEGAADWKPLSDVLGIRQPSPPPPQTIPEASSATAPMTGSAKADTNSSTQYLGKEVAKVKFLCECPWIFGFLYKIRIYCDGEIAKQVCFGEKPVLTIPAGTHSFKARSHCGPFTSTSDEVTIVLPPGAREIIHIAFNATKRLTLSTTSTAVNVKPNYLGWVLSALFLAVLLFKMLRIFFH